MRALGLAAAALALAAAPALGQSQPPAPSSSTVTPGVLTVGLNMPSSGFQVGAVKGTQVVLARGLEVDLARAVGARVGLPVQFVQAPTFSSLIAGGTTPWDLGIAQITITSGRKQRVAFSTPYLRADQGVLLAKGVTGVNSIAALKPLRVCSLKGTTSATIARTRIAPATPVTLLPTETRLEQNLRTGLCQAAVLDAPILATLASRAPQSFGSFAGVIGTGENYGIAMPLGSSLAPQVNAAVRDLTRNGTITRLQRKWLSRDLSRLPVLS